MSILWQLQSRSPDNSRNFRIIAKWWNSLNKKRILWKQRLIPDTGKVDWNPQRFDETFECIDPDVRGITFYWKKGEAKDTGNITPMKLEFSPSQQRIYLYPEINDKLIISVEIAGIDREKLQREHPEITFLHDHYEIKEVLGQSDFTTMYLAFDWNTDRQCAIKCLSLQKVKEWEMWELFEHEAKILKNLDHPQIPDYMDFF